MIRRQRGYSLIELSVVLVLVAMLTMMVLPNLAGIYSNMGSRNELQKILVESSALSHKAFVQGGRIEILNEKDAKKLIPSLASWRVQVELPVKINHKGFCGGGQLRLAKDQYARTIGFTPPYCQPIVNDS